MKILLATVVAVTSSLAWAETNDQPGLSPGELKKFEGGRDIPPEIGEIEGAEHKEDYQLARRLEDNVLSRADGTFETKWRASWIKSLALRKRFQDRQILGDTHKQVLDDLLKSARSGNLESIRQAEDILEEYLAGMNPDEYPPLTDSDVLSIFKIGAELADPPSALSYGEGRTQLLHSQLPGSLTTEERIFWIVLGLLSDKNLSRDQRKAAITQAAEKFGASAVTSALSKYGIAGGVTNSLLPGVPGRDLYSAFAAEEDLRAQYSIAYGTRMPPTGTPVVDMSALELFDDMTAINKDVGIGNFYILLTGRTQQERRNMVSITREAVTSNILPDDRLIVRCGPLSHIAIVYRIEKSENKIWFADPLYQYWLPSHNDCMTKADLVDGPYGGFLVMVPLDEVQRTLQAIITKRSD